MTAEPAWYVRRNRPVAAMLLTEQDAEAVAAWCGGRLVIREVDGIAEQQLMIPGSAIPATLGMFVLREDELGGRWRYYPVRAEVFGYAYQRVNPEVAEEHF